MGVGVSTRRQVMAWALAAISLPLLTVLLTHLRGRIDLPADLLIYLLAVMGVTTVGGTWPGLGAAVAADLLANWYFIPPIHTFTISDPQNILALVAFLIVAGATSFLVGYAARRAEEATRGRAEAAALVRMAGALLADDDPLTELVIQLRTTFGFHSAAVLRRSGTGRWQIEAGVGEPLAETPDAADHLVSLDPETVVTFTGPRPSADDRYVLRAFTDQIAVALESRELRSQAATAAALAEANNLRTALLRAVSHDLRTPLASIKASATTLRSDEVDWPPDITRQLAVGIDEGADQLNSLINNLLDMSRLQAGAVDLVASDIAVDTVVARALASLPDVGARVVIDVDESLPRLHTDAALLERAVANVVANALDHSPPDIPVCVQAGVAGGRLYLRVIDRGPGIPVGEHERIFQPFQRLGNRGIGGVGLGLSVARGFVEALGGQLAVEDTPGGGTTMVFSIGLAS